MEWQVIVALVVMIPIILLPVFSVWLLNIGGFAAIVRRMQERRAETIRRRAEVRPD